MLERALGAKPSSFTHSGITLAIHFGFGNLCRSGALSILIGCLLTSLGESSLGQFGTLCRREFLESCLGQFGTLGDFCPDQMVVGWTS